AVPTTSHRISAAICGRPPRRCSKRAPAFWARTGSDSTSCRETRSLREVPDDASTFLEARLELAVDLGGVGVRGSADPGQHRRLAATGAGAPRTGGVRRRPGPHALANTGGDRRLQPAG